MAIAFRSFAQADIASSATITVNVPAGVVDGDLLIAFLEFGAGKATTDPTGWTLILNEDDAVNAVLRGVYRFASNEPASYMWTFAGGAGPVGGVILAYTGVSTVTPLDTVTPLGNFASTASGASPSITSVTDNAWIVNALGNKGFAAGAWHTVSAGFNERVGSNWTGTSSTVAAADSLKATAGAVAGAVWNNGAVPWQGISCVLRPAPYARPKRGIAQVNAKRVISPFSRFR